ALHRIAYLLYAGLNSSLNSSNIIIISPNDVFSEYISNILPELGEDSVIQVTFYELAQRILKESFALEQRESQLEFLIDFRNTDFGIRRKENVDFKGSISFVRILDRLIDHFGRQAIAFEDISYDGKIVMTRQQLKNRFLNNKFNIPMVKQLQRLEKTVLDKIQPLKKNRFKKIRDIVDNSEGRDFEEESFSRLLMIKYSRSLARQLRKLSRIDFIEVYRLLFEDRELIGRLSKGLELPEKIDLIARDTLDSLNQGRVQYEDIGPLLYLKLKIEGEAYYPEIKQVVIDETQDYYPIQFEVFNLLFKESKYTLLGDIYQSVEKDESYSFYDHIASIFSRERTAKLFIKKSYRSSYEISKFNQRLLGKRHLTFMRHGQEPQIIRCKNEEAITLSIAKDIGDFLAEGGKSLAVICKTQKEADKVYLSLKSKKVQVGLGSNVLDSKAVVIPGYNAKGLEFDTVIVYNGNRSDYTDIFDKKLLYVACTRALHNLRIYYTGEKSHFLAFCPSLQRK
ncbi:MAG: ATP-binding domain-containing protein, partial [Peptococcaceae bacterium]|nr:ATP-binding domain-containing protein [Peptococcaceae bacterium]